MLLVQLAVLLRLLALVALTRSASPRSFFPSSIPIAVRSPYLSAWLPNGTDANQLSSTWLYEWGEPAHLSWAGLIRVDGITYSWLGSYNRDVDNPPWLNANITNVQITPTRSTFTMQAGPMNMTVAFLSPIERSDWVLQSLSATYLSVEASSLDGQAHSVQLHSDTLAEWLSGQRSSVVNWTQGTTDGGSIYFQFSLEEPEEFAEYRHQAQDGDVYFAMPISPGITWQIGYYGDTRTQFTQHGSLTDSAGILNFGPIDPTWVDVAFAIDLGRIQSTASPVTFVLLYSRNPSISYHSPEGKNQRLSPYSVMRYGPTEMGQAIDELTSTISDAVQRAIALDSVIMADAQKISSQYTDLVSLAARQTMASLDITVSTGTDGRPNASDVRTFMKDIGSLTENGRVNPVERMYAALPMFLYINASLVGPLLSPLLEAQDGSGLPYAAQDLGASYPNATGPRGPHGQGVEQSGNMLIMLYAHARFSGDGSLIHRHYDLAKRWADYLVNNTIFLANQVSTDNENMANNTNLAIKGVIGVRAMAEISHALAQDVDAQHYNDSAIHLLNTWSSMALSSDQTHLLGVYGDDESWALLYNLYADRLLGTNLISNAILRGQTNLYKGLLASEPGNQFGLPSDSNSGALTAASWLLFTAATVLDDDVRDDLIRGVWTRTSSNTSTTEFADKYDTDSGAFIEGNASPALGAMFSLLALGLPRVDIVVPSGAPGGSLGTGGSASADEGPHHATPTDAIVGGVVGGVAFVVLAAALSVWLRRRRRDRSSGTGHSDVRGALSDYGSRSAPYSAANSSAVPQDGATDGIDYLGSPEQKRGRNDGINPTSESTPIPRPALRSANSTASSRSGTISSRQPTSTGWIGSDTGTLSTGLVYNLRDEIVNLRQEMREICVGRLELPPGYSE